MFRKSLLVSALWIAALGLVIGAGTAILRAQESFEKTLPHPAAFDEPLEMVEKTLPHPAAFDELLEMAEKALLVPNAFEQLLDTAQIVALIKVHKVNDEAAEADGPVYVEIQVMKVLRGTLPMAGHIRFGASAWVGPNYQRGEMRIVFLNRVEPKDRDYYTQSIWHSIEAGKLDIFYNQDDINASTEPKLREGLSLLEGEAFGVQVDFYPKRRHKPIIVARQREEPPLESPELEAEAITDAPETADLPIADPFQENPETLY